MFKETTQKTVSLDQFLTEAQIERCITIFQNDHASDLAKIICEKVIRPNIEAINQKLGQENDPMYLAYMVEYVLRAASKS